MWGPNADPSRRMSRSLPVSIRRANAADHAAALGVMGSADQTVVTNFEDVRSYRAFERALIGSVDPRSVIELELVHRLASLLWRLRRASAIETGLFELQGELLPARRQDPVPRTPVSRGTPPPPQANGHSKVPGSNGRDHPPVSDREPLSTSMHPPLGPWSKSRSYRPMFPAPFPS